jgi:multidrug efflux pump subunit AcrA (membrane-fusion protein)
MNSRRLTIILGIVLLLAAGFGSRALLGLKQPAPTIKTEAAPRQVKVMTAQNGPSSATLEITGRLVASQKIDVFSEVGGVLLPESNRFKEGNYFSKGEALVSIDRQEAALTLMAQKSSLLNQVTLMLPELKTDYPESFPAWEAYVAAFDPSKALAALPEPKSEKEKYLISARNLYNLYFSIQSQEERMRKYVIRAPFSGVVAAADIREGTLVRVGQKLGEFFNPADYELEAAVSVGDLRFVVKGQQVVLTSADLEGTWRGTVARISDRIDPATQTARVIVRVQGKGLKEGMYLSGKIQGKSIQQVVSVPRGLLVDQTKLWVVKDSTLQFLSVTPVRYGSDAVLVRGVPDGAQIALEAVAGAFEGMAVSPYKP